MRLHPLSTEFRPVASHLLPAPFNPMAVYPEEIQLYECHPGSQSQLEATLEVSLNGHYSGKYNSFQERMPQTLRHLFQVNTSSKQSTPLFCQTPPNALTPLYEYRDPVAGLSAKLAQVVIRLLLQLQPDTCRDESTA